jgi:hypothetical protein
VRLRLPVVLASVLVLSACSEVQVPDLPDVDTSDIQQLGELSEGVLEGADGITKYLEENYQLTGVESVDCPPTPSLSWDKGATFDCTIVLNGESKTVEVSVLNESGGIQVSEPK